MHIHRNEATGFFTMELDAELQHKWRHVQAFLDEMKDAVPVGDRTWDPDSKVWTIRIIHYTTVRGLYEKHFIPKEQTRLEL